MAVHVSKAWKTRNGAKKGKRCSGGGSREQQRTHVTLKPEKRQLTVLGARGMGDGERGIS